MRYTSITSAQGWYFTHKSNVPDAEPVVYQVAAWALQEPEGDAESRIVGLIAPFSDATGRYLHEVPPIDGRYLQFDQLNDEERKAMLKR